MNRIAAAPLLALFAYTAAAAPGPMPDADTQAWWDLTVTLSDDSFEGRDTGSPGYERAATLVADKFAAAGLKPAGDNGGFFQALKLHEVAVDKDGTSFAVKANNGKTQALRFLHDVTVTPAVALPTSVEGALTFRGYCTRQELSQDVAGKIVVCFGNRRNGAPFAADRVAAAVAAKAAGLIDVDDPHFTVEPPRWPFAYARSVVLDDGPRNTQPMPVMRLNAASFERLLAGSGRNAKKLLADGDALRTLPNFEIPATFSARFALSQRDYDSSNVLALLPGTDPALSPEILVVSAHLDGYGFGEAVAGDALYNGAFDDAAYVSTLVRLAERRQGKGFKRSVLFAVFTGEEKGLLGSNWFVRHPTVPAANIAAAINLDQLRPLFPLRILTMLAVERSTLGETVKRVAAPLGIEIREDREPERRLLERADHWPFLKAGIPATGFIFGYDPGTEAERRYREWYHVRYHRPQDDITQPFDPKAASDFNRFFYTLAETVAEQAARPAMLNRDR